MTDRDAIAEAANNVSGYLDGRNLAALVNNAGVAVAGPLQLIDDDAFDRQLLIHVSGTRNVTNAFLPMLGANGNQSPQTKPGKIINISSISGIMNTPINGAYCISKHAMESMSEVYRRELRMYGIRVVTIQPGPIQSRIWEKNIGTMAGMETGDYGPMISSVNRIMASAQRDALPARVISELIHKIIGKRRPRTSYVVHRNAWMIRLLSDWIPSQWMDRYLARKLSTFNE